MCQHTHSQLAMSRECKLRMGTFSLKFCKRISVVWSIYGTKYIYTLARGRALAGGVNDWTKPSLSLFELTLVGNSSLNSFCGD